MALPKIDLPLFETILPSTGETIKLRPYTVKEEKILLVAQESEDPAAEILATKQVVNNCLQGIDCEDLPMFDIEYLLLKLRSRSVDNKMVFSIKDPETEESISIELNIDELELKTDEGHTNEVKINEQYTLFLKYPSINTMLRLMDMDPADPLVSYNIMVSCLDKIASDDEIEYFKDYTDAEIQTFMEDLPNTTLQKVTNFFETMPKLRHEVKYKNKEGKEQTFVIEGNRSFFI